MPKPKIPSQKKTYQKVNSQISKVVKRGVASAEERLATQAALLAERRAKQEEAQSYVRHANAEVQQMFQDFTDDIEAFVKQQTDTFMTKAYNHAAKVEGIVRKHYSGDGETQKKPNGDPYEPNGGKRLTHVPTFYSTKDDVLKAFQDRVDAKGFNISNRIWNLSDGYKEAIEDAIKVAMKKGQGPVALSHRLVKYLNDYDSLNNDYKKKFGTARKARDCHYAALRLAYTEIQMAYREAERQCWQQIDEIIGFDVRTNDKKHHAEDVCDMLAGKYPKTFKWLGWHPMCHCYAVPIFKDGGDDGKKSKQARITKPPENFKKWVTDNTERIAMAEERKTLPYFLADNKKTWKSDVRRYKGNTQSQSQADKGKSPFSPGSTKGVSGFKGTGLSSRESAKLALESLNDKDYAAVELAKLSASQKKNVTELLESLGGGKIGEPMRFFEADNGMANQSNAKDVCVNSVFAFESRRRGANVTAKGIYDDEISCNPYKCLSVPKTGKVPEPNFVKLKDKEMVSERALDILKEKLDNATSAKGGRYSIAFDYEALSNDGHILFAERTPKGLVLYDALDNNFDSISSIYRLMDKSHGLEVLRLDNLEFATPFLSRILSLAT